MKYEPVIGLEVHAELETRSKMFCGCPVVDSTLAAPNTAVCPICSGMPGVLPVVNIRAVEYALRVALALQCEIAHTSQFARKNYFYPDLPKGYQISQYEQPLARNGLLAIQTPAGERDVHIRRIHLEEDTGKLTHVDRDVEHAGPAHSLVDLNRAGVPLLEIVSEPDLHSVEEVRAYASGLRSLLRYLGVNSGDLQKGVMRIEPNVSVRPAGSTELQTRVEIKNLNSFRALERGIAYEIERQIQALERGQPVLQETVGWDDAQGITVSQRVKEGEDDYRYFPEPDLPPLVIHPEWIEQIRAELPELPAAKFSRFRSQYGLNAYDAGVLTAEPAVADFYERAVAAIPPADRARLGPKRLANWLSGELFGLLNQAGISIEMARVSPEALAMLAVLVARGQINQNTGKQVLAEMFASGESPEQIVARRGLQQITDSATITDLVQQVLMEYPQQVADYRSGRESLLRWLMGQVMQATQGQANPQLVQQELERQIHEVKL